MTPWEQATAGVQLTKESRALVSGVKSLASKAGPALQAGKGAVNTAFNKAQGAALPAVFAGQGAAEKVKALLARGGSAASKGLSNLKFDLGMAAKDPQVRKTLGQSALAGGAGAGLYTGGHVQGSAAGRTEGLATGRQEGAAAGLDAGIQQGVSRANALNQGADGFMGRLAELFKGRTHYADDTIISSMGGDRDAALKAILAQLR